MKKALLAVSTAALLAGTTAIWAQGVPAGGGNAPESNQTHSVQHPSARPDEGNTAPGAVRPDENGRQDQNGPLQHTQLQGQDRDQTQTGRDRLEGGEMLRGGDMRPEGGHPLTIQERTNLRQTVLLRGPRVTHVNFRIGVGAVVPRTVRLVPVPQPILAIYPEWSGDMFFSYGDEIVVVAPDTMQIVGVLAV
ncbi:MAG TPA: DUF1236 domain-containing protein [Rhizomicrobium sp.]|nr:DUF1236 domain-containing protein [Rhizomicrobium sp.]